MRQDPLPSDPAQIEAAKQRLAAARPRLLERPTREILSTLGALLDELRAADSPGRQRLEERLLTSSGFGAKTLRRGLELGLEPFDAAALERLYAREIEPQLADGRSTLSAFSTTAVWLGGVIPMPTIVQCLVPLLLRSPALVRCSERDPWTARVLVERLAELDPELARCLEVVSFSHADAACQQSFLGVECATASGSDATLTALAARIRPHQRWQGYGHRVSIALIGPGATRGEALVRASAALSLDVSLWDQLGCLSPLALFVIDASPAKAAERVAESLAGALGERALALPRGRVEARASARIRQERGGAEMRAAAGQRVAVFGQPDSAYSVVLEQDARWRPTPGYRFVRVHPLPDLTALRRALQPLTPHLAAAAVTGFDDAPSAGCQASGEALERELVALGVSRICPPGSMQRPPLDWHHDGQPVLLPLARFSDREPPLPMPLG